MGIMMPDFYEYQSGVRGATEYRRHCRFYFSAKQAAELFKESFWDRRLPRRRFAKLLDGREVEYTEMDLPYLTVKIDQPSRPHAERYSDSVFQGIGEIGRFEMWKRDEMEFSAICDRCKNERSDCLVVPYDIPPALVIPLTAEPTADDIHRPSAIMCAACRRLKEEARSRR